MGIERGLGMKGSITTFDMGWCWEGYNYSRWYKGWLGQVKRRVGVIKSQTSNDKQSLPCSLVALDTDEPVYGLP